MNSLYNRVWRYLNIQITSDLFDALKLSDVSASKFIIINWTKCKLLLMNWGCEIKFGLRLFFSGLCLSTKENLYFFANWISNAWKIAIYVKRILQMNFQNRLEVDVREITTIRKFQVLVVDVVVVDEFVVGDEFVFLPSLLSLLISLLSLLLLSLLSLFNAHAD